MLGDMGTTRSILTALGGRQVWGANHRGKGRLPVHPQNQGMNHLLRSPLAIMARQTGKACMIVKQALKTPPIALPPRLHCWLFSLEMGYSNYHWDPYLTARVDDVVES